MGGSRQNRTHDSWRSAMLWSTQDQVICWKKPSSKHCGLRWSLIKAVPWSHSFKKKGHSDQSCSDSIRGLEPARPLHIINTLQRDQYNTAPPVVLVHYSKTIEIRLGGSVLVCTCVCVPCVCSVCSWVLPAYQMPILFFVSFLFWGYLATSCIQANCCWALRWLLLLLQ